MHIKILLPFILGFLWFSSFDSYPPVEEYTYKARNLKPRDFGIDADTWERALDACNDELEQTPDNRSFRLLRAIAYREMGLRRALLLRARDWRRSTSDFEYLLERDSLFKDVLYQYGMLQRYQGHFEAAFELMHRHQEVKNPEPYVEASLFRLYRHYLAETSRGEVEEWIDARSSDYITYFNGELLRKDGQLQRADSVFSALLKKDVSIPVQPILLSRARSYYELGRPLAAQRYVYQAIEAIENDIDARMVFEDFKYILSDAEAARYRELRGPADFQHFFFALLEKRNPLRAEEEDVRLKEHYHRLLEAERSYAQYALREAYRVIKKTASYQALDSDFPYAYWLNGELGDRGLILVRHGAPDDKAASVSDDTPYIESWKYNNPDLVFHFEGHTGLGILIPVLPMDLDVLEAREVWGGVYVQLSQVLRRWARDPGYRRAGSYELELYNYRNELFDRSLKDVYEGLSSDRYRWPDEVTHLDIPYMIASFRGAGNKTAVDVHYAIPLGQVTREMEMPRRRLSLDVGLSVHDTLWNAIHSELKTRTVRTIEDPTAAAIDVLRFEALPDSYHVNLHVGIDEAARMGSYQFDYSVPSFEEPGLAMSDIVPAMRVTPTEREGRYIKNGLLIHANPRAGFRKGDPLYVYFEVYDLTYSSEDETSYSITYTLEQLDRRRRGLFRRREGIVLSLTFERTGGDRSAVEYGELDVKAVSPGRYELRVTVTDNNVGTSVSSSRIIELAG